MQAFFYLFFSLLLIVAGKMQQINIVHIKKKMHPI